MENDPCIKRSGILLLDKPEGLSSNQCVQKVRHQFNKVKAGHTGNLDPLATGLLPICLGEATRFSQYLLDADKTYQARMQFGYESSTGDAEGEITAIKPEQSVSEAQLLNVCQQFTGAIEQIPPMYSALKHQGTPLYKLAREGKEVERKVRHVEIFELQLLQLQSGYADIHVRCSKGTYIRTLVEDMGRALGCGAYMSALRRTAVAPLTGEMVSLGDLQTMACEDKLQWIQPVDTMLKHMSTLTVDAGQVSDLMHGKPVQVEEEEVSDSPQLKRLYQQGQFVGLAHHHQHMLQVKRMIQDLSV